MGSNPSYFKNGDDHPVEQVLMHGDRSVSTKALAREIGVKSVRPCDPQVADRHSGYQVGGTSPFGTRRAMPVYCEASISELDRIYINGGKRGFIVSMTTAARSPDPCASLRGTRSRRGPLPGAPVLALIAA